MNRKLMSAAIVLVSVAGFLGCDSEEIEKHDVAIAWQLATGVQSCVTIVDKKSVEFDEIRIKVFEEDSADETPIYEIENIDCKDYSYTIQNLDRGSYYVTLDAMAKYDGELLPFFQADGEIRSPAEEDNYVFDLKMGKGTVQVSWGFEQGLCGPNDVQNVDIELLGLQEFIFTDVDCNDGIMIIEDVVRGIYSLSIEGYDSDGNQTHSGSVPDFEVKPGQVINSEAFVQLEEL